MDGIACTILRGGSSKGIYIERDALPPPGVERDRQILDLFGSPDVRQIDGLGGADKLTSKVAVMGRPTRGDCDIDYLFGQVGTVIPRVDWTSNCGNLSAGAALYAVHKRYVPLDGDSVKIAIHQVNTGRRLRATIPLLDGKPASKGDFAIGGVPGTGPRIDLDFGDFGGGAMKKGVLPTGNPVDRFDVPGLGRIDVSVIDAANLCIFVRVEDVGIDPLTGVEELQADRALIDRLEAIRATVSRDIGFITEGDVVEEMKVRVNPLLFAVAPPATYKALNNVVVNEDDHDILSRSMARRAFSKAHPGTGSIGTSVACGIEGTIAQAAYRGKSERGKSYSVRIGHPGGHLEVRARLDPISNQPPMLESAILGRTARVIMDGCAYLKA
ncbi:MAG: 2-methylaconitate isomerase [Alphaproteobacteria bacterium]|jgi:2-methylaconitate cis-trans-isomerase PrpF|nr:2-methylaconitate isomerase [Alphaproteobacteria bacterium]